MKVKKMIEELGKFDPDLEVTITDGFKCNCYHTKNIEFALFEDLDHSVSLDIGIGGCDETVEKGDHE